MYADYVTGYIWALRHKPDVGRVTANQPLSNVRIPVVSLGEDENVELYALIVSPTGKGLHRIVKSASTANR